MMTDDPDSSIRWNSVVEFYTTFSGRTGWSFLSPMIELTRWAGEQSFAHNLFPGTSLSSLCVHQHPGYQPDRPFFSVSMQEGSKMKFEMWRQAGHHRHSDECVVQEAQEVFKEFVGWLEVAAGTKSADPAWLTQTVVALAKGINEEMAFDRLPILADALQDAGCDNDEVLDHCRGPGPHVRGCWVVDLVRSVD